MRILIVGSNEVWSLERFYEKYLKESGVDIRLAPAQSVFLQYYNSSIFHKLLHKSGFSGIGSEIGKMVERIADECKPDIIWVFKGMELGPDLLRRLRQKGFPLVNYNPDNPFIFSGRGSGNKHITRSIGLYDLHFTYDRNIQERIVREYNIPCKILPFGFDLDERLYGECREQEEVVRICFLGNPDKGRASFLLQLADDLPIDVYGHGWADFIKHRNITLYPPVYKDDFWKTLRRYRVQLNLMREHNPDSHNMRSFEIPGVGGIGLFPRTQDHSTFFREQEEIFLYEDIGECRKWARTILALPEEQAGSIRRAARERSLHAGYTYRDRAAQALCEMKKLIARS